MNEMLQSEFCFPDVTEAVYFGKDTIMDIGVGALAKMIIYFDSAECSSCRISQINQWSEVVNLSKSTNGDFSPIFIFSPSKDKITDTKLEMKMSCLDFPIFIDRESKFDTANKFIPNSKLFHTFLVDRNNKIVLVGDPTINTELWALYKSTINDLIKNRGVLKPTK